MEIPHNPRLSLSPPHGALSLERSRVVKSHKPPLPTLMPQSHQTLRLVPTVKLVPIVKLLRIMFRTRCWPTTFTLLQPEMLTDGVLTGWCDQPLPLPKTMVVKPIHPPPKKKKKKKKKNQHLLVPYDPKLLDDGGEIPKSQGRGWRFNSRL
jgi:hypothetical protein